MGGMRVSSKLILAPVVIALVAGSYFYVARRAGPSAGTVTTPPASDSRTQRSGRFGITFDYPATYFFIERDLSTPSRERYSLVLIEDTPEHRELVAGRSPVAREFPPAITLDLFRNEPNAETGEQWVKDAADSNYRLSADAALMPVMLGGVPAVAYRWDGLYAGESRVLARRGVIHMWSVTALDRQDPIVRDFNGILDTVRFE